MTLALAPLTLAVDQLHFAISRRSPLVAWQGRIDAELRRLREEGAVERWLAESEAAYRAMQEAGR